MKFGKYVVPEGSKVLGGFNPGPPPPGYSVHKGGASGTSAVQFGENFIKQKLQGNPS